MYLDKTNVLHSKYLNNKQNINRNFIKQNYTQVHHPLNI
jgi:hypothetical protein